MAAVDLRLRVERRTPAALDPPEVVRAIFEDPARPRRRLETIFDSRASFRRCSPSAVLVIVGQTEIPQRRSLKEHFFFLLRQKEQPMTEADRFRVHSGRHSMASFPRHSSQT